MVKILVVDDDPYTLKLFERLFRGKPIKLDLASDGSEARRLFQTHDYNLILMDQRLPGERGLEILKEMRKERPQQVAILITGYADVSDAIRAVREGLFDYLTKPFKNLEALEAVIEKALELDRAYREIKRLRNVLDTRKAGLTLIGHSPAMAKLMAQMEQIASLDATVLLEGESGTGKSLAAKYLHDLSQNAKRDFLVVNCGGLSESLLESALFGYERGAFTGAIKTTPGYFEKADGGTLFFDEISNMSEKMQSSLLHVLQERTFSRLGSSKLRSSNFRLIFATNKRLIEEVRKGHFREDLFYRINVITIKIPPLRERGGDITLLALYFLDQFNTRFGKKVGPITPEAIEVLETISWPGNVRQLQHTIERIVALHSGGPIKAFQIEYPDQIENKAQQTQAPILKSGEISLYQKEREVFESDYLKRLLKATDGNISEAARLSGIPRQNLYVRMKRWGKPPTS